MSKAIDQERQYYTTQPSSSYNEREQYSSDHSSHSIVIDLVAAHNHQYPHEEMTDDSSTSSSIAIRRQPLQGPNYMVSLNEGYRKKRCSKCCCCCQSQSSDQWCACGVNWSQLCNWCEFCDELHRLFCPSD